jgi:hypothetical protein
MARQQRSTTLAQESTRPIARVALYARVSTVNHQPGLKKVSNKVHPLPKPASA